MTNAEAADEPAQVAVMADTGVVEIENLDPPGEWEEHETYDGDIDQAIQLVSITQKKW